MMPSELCLLETSFWLCYFGIREDQVNNSDVKEVEFLTNSHVGDHLSTVFGSGLKSSLTSVMSHEAEDEGLYNITYVASAEFGCSHVPSEGNFSDTVAGAFQGSGYLTKVEQLNETNPFSLIEGVGFDTCKLSKPTPH